MSELENAFPKKPLLISLGLHALLVLAMIVKPFFSSKIEPYEQAIRVDVVALPEKGQKIEEPTPPAPEEKPKKKEPKKEIAKKETKDKETAPKTKSPKKEVALVKDEDAGLSEEEALKKLQALTKKQPQEEKKEPEVQEIKGNRVSKGSDLIGIEKLEYSNYRGILHSSISKNWDLPKWLLEGNLSAQALIKIDSSGNIIQKKLVKSSGNTIFDQHVMNAIAAASPVSAPPEKFKDIVYYEGVLLSFPR